MTRSEDAPSAASTDSSVSPSSSLSRTAVIIDPTPEETIIIDLESAWHARMIPRMIGTGRRRIKQQQLQKQQLRRRQKRQHWQQQPPRAVPCFSRSELSNLHSGKKDGVTVDELCTACTRRRIGDLAP